ncbi:hypothetical protein ACLOJK_011895 [Asimina triloba]
MPTMALALQAIFNCGLAYLIAAWCAALKGPLFTASFSPLCLVFTTVFETAFLGQVLRLSRSSDLKIIIVGSIMVVSGLYVYLWSKSKQEAYSTTNLTITLLSNHIAS